VKALNGRRFLGLRWLNEIDCKNNEHQCFVPDDLANDHQDGEISQDSSMVVLDDGDQINLCSFIEGTRSGNVPRVRRPPPWCS